MSRILLGVSGGIAAYKALELVRLATAAGHSVRVVQTPASRRFVGAASFAALTGAPVLSSEFERDPARGAFPGQEPPDARAAQPSGAGRQRRLYLIAPASANTIAKLAARPGGQPAQQLRAGRHCPVVVAPAMNNHMYEHPATQANLADCCASAARRSSSRASGGWRRRASRAWGAWPSPRGCWRRARRCSLEAPPMPRPRRRAGGTGALARAAGARHRRGHARADRQRALHRQQLLRAHGLRARRRPRARAAPR